MKPHKDPKCGVCATNPFERNNYFYGKQFTVRDLVQEQSYLNDKRHLVNRMVLGWGVVCGLDVYWDQHKRRLVVKPGMALDCCGHEITVCEDQYFSLDDNDDDCRHDEKPKPPGTYVLCLEYYECEAEPIDLPAVGCDSKGKTEFNRIRDGFKLKLKRWDDACAKEPPPKVSCQSDSKHPADGEVKAPNCHTEDVHHYLCRKLKKCCPECEDCDCVILATVTIEATPVPPGKGDQYQGKQGPAEPPGQQPKDPIVDSCTNRKLVYNNQLLYDLIYCNHGDLPHIVDFSWRTHAYPSRQVPFDVFLKMIRDGVTVYFDQTMMGESLNPRTFMLCYLCRESGTQTYLRKQIPTAAIRSEQVGDCYATTFVARTDWIHDELDSPNSELLADTRYEPGVSVEIILRGSRIWSTAGKALDGDYLADKLPTGNGTQGGDFVDWFRVMPPTTKKTKGKSYEGEF